MLGIREIGIYIPEKKISNYTKIKDFNIDEYFIKEKIGFETLSIKHDQETVLDLCLKAFTNLKKKTCIGNIDCIVVITQNPDQRIPHTSAIIHKYLNLSKNCACFDISLGCSGYVYGLSNIISFMKFNHLKNGLLFTCDPYSKIIDPKDKNTKLLFGDAASVSYIGNNPLIIPEAFQFGTDGSGENHINCKENKLSMNGREVFNFAATIIPKHIENFLQEQKLTKDNINLFLIHQGSKYIIDTLLKRLQIEKYKIPFKANFYGNTVSSSIPILLESIIKDKKDYNRILISGFGTGFSWGSAILQIKEKNAN
ncbi:ketoacyl-ACP synthase III [Campylobacter jejuni]|nr:ketoacyl-ACP synthase III [Campylobacter jejuni]